jgi:hypothetical protein
MHKAAAESAAAGTAQLEAALEAAAAERSQLAMSYKQLASQLDEARMAVQEAQAQTHAAQQFGHQVRAGCRALPPVRAAAVIGTGLFAFRVPSVLPSAVIAPPCTQATPVPAPLPAAHGVIAVLQPLHSC